MQTPPAPTTAVQRCSSAANFFSHGKRAAEHEKPARRPVRAQQRRAGSTNLGYGHVLRAVASRS